MVSLVQTELSSLSLSLFELVTLMTFSGGLVTVWIAFRVKMAKLEVSMTSLKCEVELKIMAIEKTSSVLSGATGARLTEFVNDNKDDHNEIKESIKGIVSSIKEINNKVIEISISKKTLR